jgi:hypothetical protein
MNDMSFLFLNSVEFAAISTAANSAKQVECRLTLDGISYW